MLTALRAHGALTGLLAAGASSIVDHAEAQQNYPFVVLGEELPLNEWDVKGQDGARVEPELHTWSDYRGLREVLAIQAEIRSALDKQSLSVAGYTLVEIRQVYATAFLDADGLSRHGVQRFRALLHA